MKSNYDIKKIQEEKETENKFPDVFNITPLDFLIKMRVPPKYELPNDEEKDLCIHLLLGATQLMYNRYKNATEFPLSEKMFNKWYDTKREIEKLFINGYYNYDDVYKWIEKSINIY